MRFRMKTHTFWCVFAYLIFHTKTTENVDENGLKSGVFWKRIGDFWKQWRKRYILLFPSAFLGVSVRMMGENVSESMRFQMKTN